MTLPHRTRHARRHLPPGLDVTDIRWMRPTELVPDLSSRAIGRGISTPIRTVRQLAGNRPTAGALPRQPFRPVVAPRYADPLIAEAAHRTLAR